MEKTLLILLAAGLALIFIVLIFILCILKSLKTQPAVKNTAIARAADADVPPHIIAAITAAITAYYGSQPSSRNEFTVKRIKRLG